MQQIIMASVYPRTIAWLVRLDEWARLGEIVNYNCAMIGGYFNIIVPLTRHDTIAENYQQFLRDYDPDLIVLAPDMSFEPLESLHLHPFGIIPWKSVPQIALLDPWSSRSDSNATIIRTSLKFEHDSQTREAIAPVANEEMPNASKLSFIACGDITLEAPDYRGEFLRSLLETKYSRYTSEWIGTKSRNELLDLVREEHRFPLSGAVDILKTCCQLQIQAKRYQSFIGLTAGYKRVGLSRFLPTRGRRLPGLAILVSEHFDVEEATIFWNLRASGIYVTWLTFSDLEKSTDDIRSWLDSSSSITLLATAGGLDIIFSSPYKENTQLEAILNSLRNKRKHSFSTWHIVPYNDLLIYGRYTIPPIEQKHITLIRNDPKCVFVPFLPQDTVGMYVCLLEGNDLMIPPDNTLIDNYISSEKITCINSSTWENGQRIAHPTIIMPRFRITRDRYLKVQVNTEKPIEFYRPSPKQVIETLFTSAGFSHIELSSAARYHRNFVDRAGSFEEAAHYLAKTPYRELLEILANNTSKSWPGWILDNPAKRRALHHLHLYDVLGKLIPTEAKKYFDTVSDELPNEVVDLLEKGILERGFRLVCSSCSFNSWYPAEHVGQTFKCTRCYQSQVYRKNPLWLYKLAEVIFQGFADNMQVPLLALSFLKKSISQHYFEWVPDSNIYWLENGQELHKNVDILCICDGRLYIGEAKSNDEIKIDQISFYAKVCKQVTVDGIVFATSKPQWDRGTLQHIERLKTHFEGEVLTLTEKDLYPST